MKQQMRRRRRRIRRLNLFLLVILIVLFVKVGKEKIIKVSDAFSFGKANKEYTVSAPVKWSQAEAEQKLATMAKSDKDINKIYQNKDKYPVELLSELVNNPEMIDFVLGYLDADTGKTEGFTAEEKEEEFPLLLQWDKRWGYAPYGESDIALSGCGPTCLSMVIFSLTGNTEATPYEVAQFSENNGYYVEGSGTAWTLMTEGAAEYGVTGKELSLSEDIMKRALDAGHPIICAMGPGDFTTSGHYIVIYGYDENGFQINDPNCIARSRESWPYDQISSQIKNLWAYQ